MRKILKNVQDQLNKREEWEEEFYTYSLKINKDRIVCSIFDEGEVVETIEVSIIENMDEELLLRNLISVLYEDNINFRKSYINQSKAFYSRKVKSLNHWFEKVNDERVKRINEEMIERFKTTKKYESELNFYNWIVKDFYAALNTIAPNWKVNEIKDMILKRSKELGINAIETLVYENKVICFNTKTNNKIERVVDSYSKSTMVANEIIRLIA
jgi:hypothetical protein